MESGPDRKQRGRRSRRMLVVLAVAVVTAGCVSVRTSSDYDHGTDFSRYRTWQWADEPWPAAEVDPRISPLAQQRVRAAVERAMVAKGLVKAEPADMLVSTATAVENRQIVENWGPPLGLRSGRYGWRYDPFVFPRTTVRTVAVETIAVNMFDAASGRPIWHGQGSKLADATPDPAAIEEAVGAILASYPPPTSAQGSQANPARAVSMPPPTY